MIQRLYSAAFDSVRQAAGWGHPTGRRSLVARLRLACLLSGEVVLTDTQVLDGVMFLELGPDGVRERLGADPSAVGLDRVVVAARDVDLGRALLDMLRPLSGTKVKRFRFSSLRLGQADAEALELAMHKRSFPRLERRAEELGVAEAVGELLEQCGLPPVAARRQATAWRAWIHAAADGRVVVRPWGEPPDWAQLLVDAPVDELAPGVLSPAERDVVTVWRSKPFNRSEFYAAVADADLDAASDHRLRAWYDDVYNRGAAQQHQAGYIALVDSSTSREASAVEDAIAVARGRRSSADPVRLPTHVLDALGVMPGPVFDTARFASRSGVAAWLGGDPKGMHQVAYCLDRALEQPHPRRERMEALGVLGLGAVAALTGGAVVALDLSGAIAATLALAATALGFLGSGVRDLLLLRRTSGGHLAGLVDVSGVVV